MPIDHVSGTDPHAGQPVLRTGAGLGQAAGAVILLHGRGGGAADMVGLVERVAGPSLACLIPEAASNTWWPGRFIEPVEHNQPFLSSALAVVGGLVEVALAAGIPASRVALLGFSQGACLATEFLYQRATPLGCVVGCSGGLVGQVVAPPGPPTLGGTPVLLACSEHDPHIPLGRVTETGTALAGRGAAVELHIYPGSSHTITPEEIARAKAMLAAMLDAG